MKKKKAKKQPGKERSEPQKNIGHTGSYRSGELRSNEEKERQQIANTNNRVNQERGDDNTDDWDTGI
jgi:hypothetical protein